MSRWSCTLRSLLRPRHTRGSHLAGAALLGTAVAIAHASFGLETTEQHHVHVLLRLAYLVPLVLAAVGSGAVGGLAGAAAITAVYSLHVVASWPGLPRENANQAAFIAVYWLVGPLVGALVDRERRAEERRRLEGERLARQAIVDALRTLESALAYRDEATARHGETVAALAVELARCIGLPPDRTELVRLAGRVHDLGKIGVRDDVLYKPEKLSVPERRRIEAHPDIAADILAALPGAAPVAEIVRSHHEYLDGSGYPRGLRGREIPIEARILTVADVFCALTEPRSYHEAWSAEQALKLLASWVPHRLEGAIVQSLHDVVRRGLPSSWSRAEHADGTESGIGSSDPV